MWSECERKDRQLHDRPTGCLPAKGMAKAREAAAGLCGAEGLSAGHEKPFDVRVAEKTWGGCVATTSCGRTAPTPRASPPPAACAIAGDGAGEAATQLGRALARADRRQNNDRPAGLLQPKDEGGR